MQIVGFLTRWLNYDSLIAFSLHNLSLQGLRLIGFYGQGFAEYPGYSLDAADADLSISFATTQNNALLLLAKDINGDVSIKTF